MLELLLVAAVSAAVCGGAQLGRPADNFGLSKTRQFAIGRIIALRHTLRAWPATAAHKRSCHGKTQGHEDAAEPERSVRWRKPGEPSLPLLRKGGRRRRLPGNRGQL